MDTQKQLFFIPKSDTPSTLNRKWWKEAVVYQIYPRSFKDSNNDGVGDIKGITSKLDYLKTLGVDVVWLSPVYQSPNDDNGYDISDYCAINQEFGTMADWEEMIAEMHKRGIKLVMDLVLNHTSDEHEWFVKSRQSKENNPYRDYYIWREGKNKNKNKNKKLEGKEGEEAEAEGEEPSNWISFFGGSAWEYDTHTGEYYLHLFSKKQPDLNWENPRVRQELHNMIRFWLDKGVDGFRMDVINVISKVPDFPDATVLDADALYHWAGEHFFNGPKFLNYLSELKKEVLDPRGDRVFTVGETPDVTPEHGQEFTCEHNGVLNMLFQFELMVVDSQPGKTKWYDQAWQLNEIKRVMTRWQVGLTSGWNSLYLENHDQPRSLSRFGIDDVENQPVLRSLSAKMLATWLHMMRGTPYIYQGEELGMSNVRFDSIDDYKDLETLNYYNYEMNRGVYSKAEIMRRIQLKSRDNARTPMQWNDQPHAGFCSSSQRPWLTVNPNYKYVNAEKELGDPHSIFYHFQKLIQLRKEHLVIVYGDYQLLQPDHPEVYCYLRTLGDERLLVLANFTKNSTTLTFAEKEREMMTRTPITECQLLVSNHAKAASDLPTTIPLLDLNQPISLAPYEATVYKLSSKSECQSS